MASRSSRSSSRKPQTSVAPELPTEPLQTQYTSISLDVDRDNPRRMTVMLDGAPSSFIDLDDPSHVVFEYMEIFLTLIGQIPEGPLNVTHLGSAGSTMARAIEHIRPNSRQIGVDIDQELLDFSRTWFDLPKSPRLRLRAGDARAQLESLHNNSQDVIIRDVFADAKTPAHLHTREFTELVMSKLKPGGLYLANCADKPPLRIARSEMATLNSVRDDQNTVDQIELPSSTFMVAEPGILKGRRFGNLVLGALKAVTREDGAESLRRIDEADALLGRKLRSLAVPAHILVSTEVDSFVGTAPVLLDS